MLTTQRAKSKAYDKFYEEGEEVLSRLNPCQFKRNDDGSVSCRSPYGPCCAGCEHLGPNGCRVKALTCKLWLCGDAYHSPTGKAAATELIQIQKKADESKVPNYPRMSKEQAFAVGKDDKRAQSVKDWVFRAFGRATPGGGL